MSCCTNSGTVPKDFAVKNLAAKRVCAENINVCQVLTAGGIVVNAADDTLVVVGADGLSVVGPQGEIGSIGPQGIQGIVGPAGLSGVISAGMYAQIGPGLATLAIGQPMTYTTTVISSPVITPSTAIFNPPFTASGTVFELESIGLYEVTYQLSFAEDGGIVLFHGATVPTMLPLAYSMIGKAAAGQSQVFGSVIVETSTVSSFLSVNAAPGNAAALTVQANSSTTNAASSSVSIKFLG